MEQLGGGGSQTLFGFQCFRDDGLAKLGLAAGIGSDLPSSSIEWLRQNDIDSNGLITCNDGNPTPRAWQIVEKDGRRHEIWRQPGMEGRSKMLLPSLASLPEEYRRAKAYHLAIHPENPPLERLQEIRLALDAVGGGLLSVETFAGASKKIPKEQLSYLRSIDVFSPNEAEACSILGLHDLPRTDMECVNLLNPFAEVGARILALRRAEKGAIVWDCASDQVWKIDAYREANIVDTTGAGNAFCGAFLAALQVGLGVEEAGRFGCAAGSIIIEAEGVPLGRAASFSAEVRRRYESIAAWEL